MSEVTLTEGRAWQIPLIAITGPTASGKSGVAMELAQKWGGEIICADSRTVYRGMDVGTAKPTFEDQKKVPHWLIDVVDPDERFTLADFKKQADEAIHSIRERGKIPFLVGGTGLYIDSVVLGFSLGSDADLERRQELNTMTIEQLQSLLEKLHLSLPENSKNKRHLIRCIEKNNETTSRKILPDHSTYVFAIKTEKDILETRISRRIDAMFGDKIELETQRLFEVYDSDSEALKGNIYRIVKRYLDGEVGLDEAKNLCIIKDRQLAKRQMTWIKRHDYVRWVDLGSAFGEIDNLLVEHMTRRDV